MCQFHAYYQNQYDRPSIGRIALRPAPGFFLTRPKIETILFEIPCEAGAFGVATRQVALPREVQGKPQSFEVGASVEYPQGKGKRLRFRDGRFLRTNTDFGDAFGTALSVAGALVFVIVWSNPAKTRLLLPSPVADELTDNKPARTKVIWKLGDPPIIQSRTA